MNEVIIILVLIFLNGMFAMSEVALISARKSNLSADAKKGSKSAQKALKIANEPDRFLSTVQIGITLIGILTGIYSGDAIADDFAELLMQCSVPTAIAHEVAQIIIVVVVTYLTLVFGELLPKRIGMGMAEKMARLVAKPMNFLSILAAPLVWVLAASTSFLYRILGFKTEDSKVTEEEIKSIIQEGKEDGEVQEVEQDIVERVFLLGDMKVSSLMTYRADLVTLDISMNKAEIKRVLEDNLYQSYPVIDGTIDKIKGIVTLKSLVFQLEKEEIDLNALLSEPLYFHENMSIYNALEKMKEKHISHALVCDEFGVCQGVISMKDIMRGLIGSATEEHEDPDIIQRAGGDSWLIDGQCPFYDFLQYFDKEDLFEEYNYNTIGGLILELLEHIPVAGEIVDWNDFHIEVVDMDGARIDKVAVSKRNNDTNG